MSKSKPTQPAIDWGKVARLLLRTLSPSPMLEIYNLIKELQRSPEQLSEKVTRIISSLEEASTLVEDLQRELTQRTEQIQKLKKQHERYQHLAMVQGESAKALIAQLQKIMDKERSRERWIAVAINIGAGFAVFVLGVWLSPSLKTFFGINQ